MSKRIETWTLAFCIAFFPPIWAVLAPYANISTGAVALICAGLYVANGNKAEDGVKISIGFLLGDLWAVLALKMMSLINMPESAVTFITLFILGGLAVLISSKMSKYIFCPSWLCGWAIGLTIMAPLGIDKIGSLPLEIGAAMLVGVWYVGFFLDIAQRKLMKIFSK
ncbi:MAG: DUF1097 domain-containing protein [Clostridium sp.]|nr:DUF1097 domain-containing protein [Clostridium sp.]